ncbi:MAG: hypothetical protein GF398_17900 [Chitinivibrionales bacterium]|nr:hypothetical protein [Chitinivibrionales bacterium]
MNNKKNTFCAAILITICCSAVTQIFAEVAPYDFPAVIPGISQSSRWQMSVDGTPIRVMQLYTMGTNRAHGTGKDNSGPGAVAIFSMEGPVTVRLTADETISSYDIRPKSLGIEGTVDGNTLSFTLDRPGHCGVEINGNFSKPLFIYANPLETGKPDPTDPNVTFFEKGMVHEIGDMKLTGLENHTVYLEGGAVVLGNLTVGGSNYEVRGHGLLYSGPDSTRGPTILTVGRSKNARIRDFTTIMHWDGSFGCSVWNSDTVMFTNWRILNTAKDGLNPIGTQHMIVDSCFLFGDDDASAIKTNQYSRQDAAFITIKNSQIWNNSIEIGYETHGGDIHDIHYENLDIIHVRVKDEVHSNYPLNEMSIHVNDIGTVYNVRYEDIRIESSLSNRFFEFRIIYAGYAAYPKNGGDAWRGHIRDVYLKNIQVIDGDNFPISKIGGWDDEHLVQNLGIEGLFIYGQQILDTAAGKITINQHTRNVGLIPLGRGNEVPAAPKNLQVDEVSGISVALSWTDNSDNEWGFTIERKSADGSFEKVGTVNFQVQHFIDSSAHPSTSYTYRVRSSNRAGFCSGGATVQVTTDAPTGIGPDGPTSFTIDTINSIMVQLSWSSTAENVTGFVLKRRKSGDQLFTLLDTLAADSRTFGDAGLMPHTSYDYRLYAFNHNGQSANVDATITTPPLPQQTTLIDEMADQSHWFESVNWETFESRDSDGKMEGDSLRARRKENVTGTITWACEYICDFEVVFYHQRNLDNTQLLGSTDNRNWYEIACDIQQTQSPVDNSWYKSVFAPVADSLKQKTHFLKLEVGANSAFWNPQLSQVSVTYGDAATRTVEHTATRAGAGNRISVVDCRLLSLRKQSRHPLRHEFHRKRQVQRRAGRG